RQHRQRPVSRSRCRRRAAHAGGRARTAHPPTLRRLGRRAALKLSHTNGGSAMPPSSKHVEQMAPELERIVSPSEPIHDLADGFGGAQGPAEGPLWWKEGRYLLFSDIHIACLWLGGRFPAPPSLGSIETAAWQRISRLRSRAP